MDGSVASWFSARFHSRPGALASTAPRSPNATAAAATTTPAQITLTTKARLAAAAVKAAAAAFSPSHLRSRAVATRAAWAAAAGAAAGSDRRLRSRDFRALAGRDDSASESLPAVSSSSPPSWLPSPSGMPAVDTASASTAPDRAVGRPSSTSCRSSVPNAAKPVSFEKAAAPASSAAQAACSTRRPPDRGVAANISTAARYRAAHSRSALPTMLHTASTWMGCSANTSPPSHARRVGTPTARSTATSSRHTSACSPTLWAWYHHASSPCTSWSSRKDSVVSGRYEPWLELCAASPPQKSWRRMAASGVPPCTSPLVTMAARSSYTKPPVKTGKKGRTDAATTRAAATAVEGHRHGRRSPLLLLRPVAMSSHGTYQR